MSHSQQKGNFWVDFILGGVSGCIAKTICAPIERVKLLMQTQHTNPQLVGRQYTSVLDCFQRTIREEGALSLWRGNLANIIRYFPTTALNFAIKDKVNRIFNPYNAQKEPLKFFIGNVMAGGVAGSCSMVVVYPLDFARTRLGVDMGKGKHGHGHAAPAAPAEGAKGGHGHGERSFNGIFDCASKIYQKDGISGLYRGFGISVLGIFIYRSLYFGIYDSGKQIIFGENFRNSNIFARFFFAQLVVCFSETISYPIDTVRRRMMMQSGRDASKVDYKSSFDCFSKIYAQEGYRGFFKGNVSNIYRSFGSSLVLVMYDEFQKFLLNRQNQKH